MPQLPRVHLRTNRARSGQCPELHKGPAHTLFGLQDSCEIHERSRSFKIDFWLQTLSDIGPMLVVSADGMRCPTFGRHLVHARETGIASHGQERDF